MAEALLQRRAPHGYEVASAGTAPSTVHPLAIAAMAEVGIDIGDRRSKHLDEFLDQPFDWVITVCDHAAESCPVFPGAARRLHWPFPDPAATADDDPEALAVFRQVRDAIDRRLEEWLAGA